MRNNRFNLKSIIFLFFSLCFAISSVNAQISFGEFYFTKNLWNINEALNGNIKVIRFNKIKNHKYTLRTNNLEISKRYDSLGRMSLVSIGNSVIFLEYNKENKIAEIINIENKKDSIYYVFKYNNEKVAKIWISKGKNGKVFLSFIYKYDKNDSLIREKVISIDSSFLSYNKKIVYINFSNNLIKKIYINDRLVEEILFKDNMAEFTNLYQEYIPMTYYDTITSVKLSIGKEMKAELINTTFSNKKYVNWFLYDDFNRLQKIKTIFLQPLPYIDVLEENFEYGEKGLIEKEFIKDTKKNIIIKEYSHTYEFY